jgi:cytochrome P450
MDLRISALFASWTDDDLNRVAKAATRGAQSLDEGALLCAEGDEADRWWLIVDGLADVTVGGRYITTLGRGETVGELALFDGEPRAATVTAASALVVEEFDGAGFREAVHNSPTLAAAMLEQLAKRLRHTNLAMSYPDELLPELAKPMPATQSASAAPGPAVPKDLDPTSAQFYADPYMPLAALREDAPLQWSALFNGRLVLRYEDVHRLARHPGLIGSAASGQPDRSDTGEEMIRQDGPAHTRLRRLVSRVFTPRAVAQLRVRAEEIVDAQLDRAAQADHLDVVNDYALQLPAQIISEMLGVPSEDIPQLRAWSRTIVSNMEPVKPEGLEDAIGQAGQGMHDYLGEIVAQKRKRPGDDIISALLASEEAGDSLTESEVHAQVILLYIAGHETTVNVIGNGVGVLLHHPDQLARLHIDPSLDGNAVEEVLRYESPAHFTFRIPREEVTVGDTAVSPGDLLVLALGSANRDPRKWGPTADMFDIARTGANEHTSFGGGPHYCLGATLTRMQGQLAIPRLIRRFPRMQPVHDTLDWAPQMMVRGLNALPVTLR